MPEEPRVTILPSDSVFAELRAEMIAVQRKQVEWVRDALERTDPRGRHLSLAITHLEDAEFRLRAADAIPWEGADA